MDTITNSATANALRTNYRAWLSFYEDRGIVADRIDVEPVIALAASLSGEAYSSPDWIAALDFEDRPSVHRARAARRLVRHHLPADLRSIDTGTLYAWRMLARRASKHQAAACDSWDIAQRLLGAALLMRRLGYYKH